jgi:hypothetical protein
MNHTQRTELLAGRINSAEKAHALMQADADELEEQRTEE